MKAQTVFDRVVNHLLTQKKQSKRELCGSISCAYRGDNGLSCAVGCLLSDKAAKAGDALAENGSSTLYDLVHSGLLPKHLLAHQELLACLQSIHDDNKPQHWRGKLKRFAAETGLEFRPEV